MIRGRMLGVLVGSLLLSVVSIGSAQQISSDRIFIWNSGGQEIYFELAGEDFGPTEFRLGPDQTDLFDVGWQSECDITIRTGDKLVRYRLNATKRYQIYWNEEAAQWDLGEIRPN